MAGGVGVTLRGLTRRYREGQHSRRVLDDLTGAIAAGEYVAIVGRSGCGKSTLLNVIAGIDRPDAGAVVVGGRDLTTLSERARTLVRRRQLGFVYQFFHLIPTLTVLENLCLPLELNGWSPAQGRERAREWLARVELSGYDDEYPDVLSGGEQQRVALARALVHDPGLVLADEPTGNLDAQTGEHMAGLLDDLVRQGGKTLMLVTHEARLADSADRCWYMADGRLGETPP